MVYAPALERDLEQPIAGSIPVLGTTRLVITEGNYRLLGDRDWARVQPQPDGVWYCDLDEGERVRRLILRHERFGKAHDAAVAWVERSDQRNTDLVSSTRDRADRIVPDSVLRTLQDSHPTIP